MSLTHAQLNHLKTMTSIANEMPPAYGTRALMVASRTRVEFIDQIGHCMDAVSFTPAGSSTQVTNPDRSRSAIGMLATLDGRFA